MQSMCVDTKTAFIFLKRGSADLHSRSNNRTVVFHSMPPQAVDRMLSDNQMQFFMLPKYSNDRIAAQDGAFLLCSTPYVKKADPGYGDGVFQYPDEAKDDYEKIIACHFVIPKELKEEILSQLDSLGVNEARLFPDVEHRAKSLVAAIRRTDRENIKPRRL